LYRRSTISREGKPTNQKKRKKRINKIIVNFKKKRERREY